MLNLDQFDFILPDERIAHEPASPRDSSRLLLVDRHGDAKSLFRDQHFFDLPDLLHEGDVIVRNNTKVMPARIFGRKETGGRCEILLVKSIGLSANGSLWECMTKPGLKISQKVSFEGSNLTAHCAKTSGYTRTLEFSQKGPAFFASLDKIGHTPVPPYIRWQEQDEQHLRDVYQTTYAKTVGSVAAPTAGLHFTPELDQRLQAKRVQIEEVTLHVGLGTFLPLQPEHITSGQLHHEAYVLSPETAARLNAAKKNGQHIIAVGTTTTRVLETCSEIDTQGMATLRAGTGETSLFIQPGFRFKFVDGMITNFHLPHSSLLMLISAFVSAPNTEKPFVDFASSVVGRAYQAAIERKYRFYSFGDAMLIL
jgi:S-adenosylmethionine:tRNA ribosyltransferase-isomerase